MIWQVLKWISKILFIDTEQLAKMSSSSHLFFKDFFERLRATYFKNGFLWEFCWLISDWKKTESSQKYSWRILIIDFKASMTKNTSFKGALTKILNVSVLHIYIPSHTELPRLLKSPQISSNLKFLKSPLISKNIDFQENLKYPQIQKTEHSILAISLLNINTNNLSVMPFYLVIFLIFVSRLGLI